MRATCDARVLSAETSRGAVESDDARRGVARARLARVKKYLLKWQLLSDFVLHKFINCVQIMTSSLLNLRALGLWLSCFDVAFSGDLSFVQGEIRS